MLDEIIHIFKIISFMIEPERVEVSVAKFWLDCHSLWLILWLQLNLTWKGTPRVR